jgi:hypothetical protein
VATIESYETSTGAKPYMVRYRTPQLRRTKKRGFNTKRVRKQVGSMAVAENDNASALRRP